MASWTLARSLKWTEQQEQQVKASFSENQKTGDLLLRLLTTQASSTLFSGYVAQIKMYVLTFDRNVVLDPVDFTFILMVWESNIWWGCSLYHLEGLLFMLETLIHLKLALVQIPSAVNLCHLHWKTIFFSVIFVCTYWLHWVNTQK
jgi:hypothetical protein